MFFPVIYYGQIFSHSSYLIIIEPERRPVRDRMRIVRLAQVSPPFIHAAVIVALQWRSYSGDTLPVDTVTRLATPLENEAHALRHKHLDARHARAKLFLIGCRRVVQTGHHETE
jgi:hypothetical protein